MKEYKTMSNVVLLNTYEGFKAYEYRCIVHNRLPVDNEMAKLNLCRDEILSRMHQPELVKLEVKTE